MPVDHGKGVAKDGLSDEYEISDTFLNQNLLKNYYSIFGTHAATENGEQTNHPQLNQVQARGGAGRSVPKKRSCSTAELIHKLAKKRQRDKVQDQLAQLQELMPNFNKNTTDITSILGQVIEYIGTQKKSADELVSVRERVIINGREGYNQVQKSSIESFLPNSTDLDLNLNLGLNLGLVENDTMYRNNNQLPLYPMIFNGNPYDPIMVPSFLDVQVQSAMMNYHHEQPLPELLSLLPPLPDLPPLDLMPPLLDLLPPS